MNENDLLRWVKENLEYRDGDLWWKDGKSSRRITSSPAGTINSKGYRTIQKYVGGEVSTYKAHRLIFLLHYGWLPNLVDHADNNKLNNRIENLRAANLSKNSYNSKTPNTNTSGVKGVSYRKDTNKWRAQLWVDGRYISRAHKDRELIDLVMLEMREKYHGEFARHA